jgi:hypothetical protein
MKQFSLILFGLSLCIQCSAPDSPQDRSPEECLSASFHLKQGSYGFYIQAAGDGSLQQVEIRLSGFPDTIPTIQITSEPVMGAEATDLDSDGYPEILVFTQSAGSGSYGNVIAYTYSPEQGFRPILMPDLAEDSLLNEGYAGHDLFRLEGTRVLRRFPLYQQESRNSEPGDSSRTILYSFMQDEQAPRFRIDGASRD